MLRPGVILHVYGTQAVSPEALPTGCDGLAGVLEEDEWTYLVFTGEARALLAEAGVEVAYEARLPYEEWLDGDVLEPFEVGSVTVVPPWCEPPRDRPPELVLRVEPSLAFGTGAHPTTRRCLEVLCDLAERGAMPRTVLDLGCGTGLLSLAALRLGAEWATGCDTSPLAVEVARRNAVANGLENRAAFRCCSARELVVGVDLVVANLPPAASAELCDHPALPGCQLAVLSGMLEGQARALVSAPPAGLELIAMHEDGPWRTALLRPGDAD